MKKKLLILFNKKKQKGFASAIIIFVLLTIIFSLSSKLLHKDTQATDFEKLEYLNEVQKKLEIWFLNNLSIIDSYDETKSPSFENFSGKNDCQRDTILTLAGITPKYGISVALSNPILNFYTNENGGQLVYRRLAVYIPNESNSIDGVETGYEESCGDSSLKIEQRMNKNTGDFRAKEGDIYKIIEGLPLEQKKYLETVEKMKRIAYAFENRMYAKVAADPMGSRFVNWFRATNCNEAATQTSLQPQCTDTAPTGTTIVKPITSVPDGFSQATILNNYLNIRDILTLPQQDLFDAWGEPIYFCNSPECSNAENQPYTLTMLSVTPWKSKILFTAIQK